MQEAECASDLPVLVRMAIDHVRSVEAVPGPELSEAVEMLVDRYALSCSLAKPVGIAIWAEHYTREFGRLGALEIAEAVSHAFAEASALAPERSAIAAFLRVLEAEVAHYAIEHRASPSNPGEKAAEVLISMLAARDDRAMAHARAVSRWATRICAELRRGRESTEFVAQCALLHDVGMISTPEAILNKHGALSGVEMAIVREHAAAGERILRGIPELERCADVVRSHHERWDGTGYPDGISGANIPFESRIVAVADGFHAMISERPHRLPISPRVALEILAEGRGTQWDPTIVDALHAMFDHVHPGATRERVTSA